jgi:hypothetical protein
MIDSTERSELLVPGPAEVLAGLLDVTLPDPDRGAGCGSAGDAASGAHDGLGGHSEPDVRLAHSAGDEGPMLPHL